MNDHTMGVIRAFRDFDKAAGCSAHKSDSREKRYRLRYGKKATIVKESMIQNTTEDTVDVEVTRIEKSARIAALDAIESMKDAPDRIRPSGVSNAAVAKVGMLRSKIRSDKRKQEEIDALGNMMGPKMAALDEGDAEKPSTAARLLTGLLNAPNPAKMLYNPGGYVGDAISGGIKDLASKIKPKLGEPQAPSAPAPKITLLDKLKGAMGIGIPTGILASLDKGASVKVAAGPTNGQPDPYEAFRQMKQDGDVVSKAIPGINPDIVMQGQQMGIDMTPAGIKKRLGAHEMIAKGKKILADENKNGIPDIAEGGDVGSGGPMAGGAPGGEPQLDPAQMVAAAKLRMPDLEKSAADSEKTCDCGMDPCQCAKPGTIYLASDADTPPSNAPKKAPEKESENEAEIKPEGGEKKAYLGTPIGAIYGAVREKEPREDRGDAIIRSGMTGLGTDVGMGLGLTGGTLIGGGLGSAIGKLVSKKKRTQELAAILGAVVGGAGGAALGGYAGHSLMKRKPETRGEKKIASDMGSGEAAPSVSSTFPRREGFKTTNRQDVFDNLSKWSLGAKL